MHAWKLIALVLVLIAGPVLASQNTKEAKLFELMKIQGLTEMMEQQRAYGEAKAKAVGPKILEEFKKQNLGLSQSASNELNNAYAEFVDTAKPTWTVKEAVATWAQYYGEKLTEEELDKIIAFYKSPIGQKDIQASREAMPKWAAFLAEKNDRMLDTALKKFAEKLRTISQRATKSTK